MKSSHEGLGVGRQILYKAEKQRVSSHDLLWLETEKGSRAYIFYTKAGWLPVQEMGKELMTFSRAEAQPAMFE